MYLIECANAYLAAVQLEQKEMAVSYTHLTLPTILLV